MWQTFFRECVNIWKCHFLLLFGLLVRKMTVMKYLLLRTAFPWQKTLLPFLPYMVLNLLICLLFKATLKDYSNLSVFDFVMLWKNPNVNEVAISNSFFSSSYRICPLVIDILQILQRIFCLEHTCFQPP